MKKRIISIILALSMMLSLLPVSAFADASGGSSTTTSQITSITKDDDYETVGTNPENSRRVVVVKMKDGKPVAADAAAADGSYTGTGWMYVPGDGLILGISLDESAATTEFVLDGTADCTVVVTSASTSGATVPSYLKDSTVTGLLSVQNSACILSGTYSSLELENGCIYGGVFDHVTSQTGGTVYAGYFHDISGLSATTQAMAHKLLLPDNVTLNGASVNGDVYMILQPFASTLELTIHSENFLDGWAVVSSDSQVLSLPSGLTDYPVNTSYTVNGAALTIATITTTNHELHAVFNAIPTSSDGAPLKVVGLNGIDHDLHFGADGLPELDGVPYVDCLDETDPLRAYLCRNWFYYCYPENPGSIGTVEMGSQNDTAIDLISISDAPIQCSVQIQNAKITNAQFGNLGHLVLYYGTIENGTYDSVSLNTGEIHGGTFSHVFVGSELQSQNPNGTRTYSDNVINGGTFNSLSFMGNCAVSNVTVLDSISISSFDGEYTVQLSDSVVPENVESSFLAEGQKISKLQVRNGNIAAVNGESLVLSTPNMYLVGNAKAVFTLDTDVLSINDADVTAYNSDTSAKGKVLTITANNDGADILVNKTTDEGSVKPLLITKEGLPDLTGITPQIIHQGEGESAMSATIYNGIGWKYGIIEYTEAGVPTVQTSLLISSPDGEPVDLMSEGINPYQVALNCGDVTLENVTITNIQTSASTTVTASDGSILKDGIFGGSVEASSGTVLENGTYQGEVIVRDATIQDGTFASNVTLSYGSKILNGSYQAAYVGSSCAVTGGTFSSIRLMESTSGSSAPVISNVVLLDGLFAGSDPDAYNASVSDTISRREIDKKYLADTQNESKVTITDGKFVSVNGKPLADGVDPSALYLVGTLRTEITANIDIENVDGTLTPYYVNEQDHKTIILTGMNNGQTIVLNKAGETPDPKPTTYTLTVNGSTSEYAEGDSLTFTAEEKDGYTFTGWEATGLDGVLTAEQLKSSYIVFKMPANPVTLTATYKLTEDQKTSYALTFDDTMMTVTVDGKAITSGTALEEGTEVTARSKMTEKPGYIALWSVNGLSRTPQALDKSYSFTMPAEAATLFLEYVSVHYELTFDSSVTVTVDGEAITSGAKLEKGTKVTVKANFVPETQVFDSWDITGITTDDTTGKFTFEMPAKAVSLAANISEKKFDELPVDATGSIELPASGQKLNGKGWTLGTDASGKTTMTVTDGSALEDKKLEGENVQLVVEDGATLSTLTTNANIVLERGGTIASGTYTGKVTGAGTITGGVFTEKPETDTVPETVTIQVTGKQSNLTDKSGTHTVYVVTNDTTQFVHLTYDEGKTVAEGKHEFLVWRVNDTTTLNAFYGEDCNYPVISASTDVTLTPVVQINRFDLDINPIKDGTLYQPSDFTSKIPGVEITEVHYYKLDDTGSIIDLKNPVTDPTEPGKYAVYVAAAKAVAAPTVATYDAMITVDREVELDGVHYFLPDDLDTGKTVTVSEQPAPKYELTFDSSVTVTVDGETITSGAELEEGTKVSVMANFAPETQVFDSWNVTGITTDDTTGKFTFEMPAGEVKLAANIKARPTYTLTVDSKATFHYEGDSVTVPAPEAKPGYTAHWNVSGLNEGDYTIAEDGSISFQMPATGVTLTSTYEIIPYTVTEDDFQYNPATLTVTYTGSNEIAPKLTVKYMVDDVLTETAPIDPGSYAVYVCVEEDEHYSKDQFEVGTYVVAAPKYELTFDSSVTVTVGGETITSGTELEEGTKVTVKANFVPETQVFDSWNVTGITTDDTTGKFTFEMPAGEVKLAANISDKTYKVTLTDASGEAVYDVVPGKTCEFTAEEKDGYTFTGWTATGLPAGTDTSKATVSFEMPANDVTLTATYEEIEEPEPETYTLTVTGADVFVDGKEQTSSTISVKKGAKVVVEAYADTATAVFKSWDVEGLTLTDEQRVDRKLEFTMPGNEVTLSTVTGTPTSPDKPAPTPDNDGGGVMFAVALVGGAAVGVGAYYLGTTAYLQSVLPDGVAIPTTREQLAVALWTAVGKPTTESTAVFSDVAADSEDLTAIRWAVESGLLSADGNTFNPNQHVSRMEVIRTWNNFRQR